MKTTCFGAQKISVAFLFLLTVNFMVPNKALSQEKSDEHLKNDADLSTAECVPTCRKGYSCLNGECKSPCNPTCSTGEVCVRSGQCIPEFENRAAPTLSLNPAYSTSKSASGTGSLDMAQIEYNKGMYERFKQKKRAGAAMLPIGIILVIGSGVMGAIAGTNGFADGGMVALFAAGVGVEILGVTLIISGSVAIAKGNRGMKKAGENYHYQSISSLEMIELGSSRQVAKTDRDPAGLTLSFDF